MHRCKYFLKRILVKLEEMISARFFFTVTCISFTLSVVWIQFVDRKYFLQFDESLVKEALDNVARDYRYVNVYRKAETLPEGIKYVLLWNRPDYAPFYFLGNGQRAFIEKNCSTINCYVTSNRHLFGYNSLSKFDAVAFNGRYIDDMTAAQLPQFRYPHQKYIFFTMESADNYPICNDILDDFFNLTSTYRLDSDIPFSYISVRNIDGNVVGPKSDMKWAEDLGDIDEHLSHGQQNKSKTAAWFVSHCSSRSGRDKLVKQLQKALSRYGSTVDVYGACGPFKCPIEKKASCNGMLERDYYFYLSFENSFAEDYVTEKLLTALRHNAVPIVFGGANYTRFLPPGSYLDATKLSPDELAATMVTLMKSPEDYQKFFRWRNYYVYQDALSVNVCGVCKALNDEALMNKKSYYNEFRKWWHPNFKERCSS